MLDDLRLDVVKGKVDVPRLVALAFCLVPFHVPNRIRNALLATELRHSPVDCNPSHDGDNTVFLLAAVHVEQHLECASCHTRFLFAKLLLNELDLDMPTCATNCQIQHGMLKITIQRVTIWRPFCFIHPLSFALPRFFACPHLALQTPY